ncbi:MAG: CarD family transcriptional regulator [Clostridia bacterium]|nr:CarD family transcriptional regulator [Clostridia bacterium]MBR0444447.1 CarD family transcriptional regulator [Clostridia bacterium]
MFQVNDLIVYGQIGVCKVTDVSVPDFFKDSNRLYYTLEPVSHRGTIFIPVDTDVYMRPVLSREESEDLIKMIPGIAAASCDATNMQELNHRYSELMRSHNYEDLISLLISIYTKKHSRLQNNQKIGSVDEAYMKRAESLLFSELSVSLGIPESDIPQYIAEKLSQKT